MQHTPNSKKNNAHTFSAKVFRRKFLRLILLTWIVPAIIGMAFLLYINMFTFNQMWVIQTKPLEPLFVLSYVAFTYWYFRRFTQPIITYFENPRSSDPDPVLKCMGTFPLHYWGLFLLYLLMAPSVVIGSAEIYTNFVAHPVDWFRIHLVALIVSIIVGLPIFFLILDLFGQTIDDIKLTQPHVTIKVKVFLIGALTPLMIDTMLVQYYWTRTNYFTVETFVVWLSLEILAIVGSLIFVRSFGQSLSPLQQFIGSSADAASHSLAGLVARSTDELGVLTVEYRELLEDIQINSEILELNNKLLRETGGITNIAEVADSIINLCDKAVYGDTSFLILHDESTRELVGVAQTGSPYKADGHFRLSLDEVSMAVMVFNHDDTSVINDVPHDPRCSPRMVSRFNLLSALAVPLRVEGKLIGVLISTCTVRQHNYTHREVLLMEGIAREAAIAIHTQKLSKKQELTRQALNKSESMLQLVLDTVPTRVYWKDQDGVYLGCNRQFAMDAGLSSPQEIAGKTDSELAWKEQAELYRADDITVMQSGKSKLNFEEQQNTLSGKRVWVETSKVPLTDDEGNILGVLGIYHDVTERKLAEVELRKHREQLEELVNERTNELVAVNKELESFSYSVSHDLRAPLRSIDGFSQAVIEDYGAHLDELGKDYLQRIRQGAQYMAQLIDDMLKLAQVTRGELKRERVDLTKIAHTIIDKLQQEDPERNVKTDISLDLSTDADLQLITIALENLLRNSWKYTSKITDAFIEVGSTTTQGKAVFFVRDNGVGFDMKYADKLFSPFQRLHRKDEFEGSGIGLATVKRIIQRHGGKLWAEAKPGKGATFFFMLGKTMLTDKVDDV